MRKPLIGMLGPGGSRVLVIEPPIEPSEDTLVIAPPATFVFDVQAPDRVSIENRGPHVVAYVITIVPAAVAQATTLPWGRILAQLQKPDGPRALIDEIVASLHRGLLPPPEK